MLIKHMASLYVLIFMSGRTNSQYAFQTQAAKPLRKYAAPLYEFKKVY